MNYEKYTNKVYILILNWNGWKDTIECLESVFRNSYSNYQVVVIDNGSTNGSMEKIKAWAEGEQEVEVDPNSPLYHLSHPLVPKLVPYIEYDRKTAETGGIPGKERLLYNKLSNGIPHPMILIRTGDNLGFAGGNNVGIRYALSKNDCEYVWLLNNDTVIDKNALTETVKLAETDKKIGIIGSKIMNYYSPNVIDVIGGGNFIPWMGIAREIGSGEVDNGQWDKKSINVTYVKGASMLVKSDVMKEIGLMNESYFLYSEETDWCIRAFRDSWKLKCSLRSLIWHKEKKPAKVYEKGNPSEFHKEYYIARNNLIILKKFYKKYLAIGFLLSFGIRFLVIVTKKEKRHGTILMKYAIKGYIDFLRGKAGRLT